MATTGNRASVCPGCGAPIDLTNGPVTCQYCRTFVEPEKQAPPPIPSQININLGDLSGVGTAVGKASRAAGCITTAVILIVVAAIGIPIALSVKDATKSVKKAANGVPIAPKGASFQATGRAVTLPNPTAGKPPDIAIQTRSFSPEAHQVRYLDGATGKVRWTADGFSPKDGGNVQIAGDDQRVYVADGTTLKAFGRVDGKQAWAASVGSAPADFCKQCLQAVGGKVVVLGRDGTVFAFDGATGGASWTQRNADSPRDLRVVAGSPAVVTKQLPPATNGVGLALFGVADGAVRHLDPACQPARLANPAFADRPGPLDPFIPTPDGKGVVVFYSGSDGCAQAFDLTTFQKTAEYKAVDADDWPFTLDEKDVAISDNQILIGSDHSVNIFGFDLGGHAAVKFDERFTVRPVAFRGGRLVVVATPSFDTKSPVLQGVDPANPANPVWTRPVAGGSVDSTSFSLVTAGIAAVECDDDAKKCTFTLVEPVGGVQLTQSTSSSIFTSAFLEAVHDDGFGYYTVATKLFVVNNATSAVVEELGR